MKLLLVLLAMLMPQTATSSNVYAVGQIWEYHTRPQDQGSLVKIQRIEPYGPKGDLVYHVSIIGVHFASAGPTEGTLAHLPVSKKTLDASVVRRVESDAAFPDPSEGIAAWRKAEGGIFTVGLSEIVAIAESTMKH